MERLTKKELRALLEFIKECYPICDLETFAQRVVSRLSRIVPTEIISHNVADPQRRRKVLATYLHAAYVRSQKKIFEPRVREHPVILHYAKTRQTTQGLFQHLGLHNKFYPRLSAKYRIAPQPTKRIAVNYKTKNL